jgi:cytoskeleton protein RodZ
MNESPDENQEDNGLSFHTDMPVGEILRRTRNHYEQSLEQIEQVLRIRATQLEALEKGEIHKLPGRVYAIGFVRSYSEYLGLDGDKMVHLFKEQSVGRKQKRPEMSFPVPASESKVPSLAIIFASIFGILVLIGFVSFLVLPDRKAVDIAEVPEALTKSQLSDAPALVRTADQTVTASPEGVVDDVSGADVPPAVTTTPTKASNRVQLDITEASWIEIRNAEGAAILRQVLKPGDIYLVPDEAGLVLSTGNAGGIKVKVDGKEIGMLGTTGQIRRKIPLTADTFLNAPKRVVPAPARTPTTN